MYYITYIIFNIIIKVYVLIIKLHKINMMKINSLKKKKEIQSKKDQNSIAWGITSPIRLYMMPPCRASRLWLILTINEIASSGLANLQPSRVNHPNFVVGGTVVSPDLNLDKPQDST